MLAFIDYSANPLLTVVYIILFIHVYFVVRYCVGNIIIYHDRSPAERFLDFLKVVFIPIVGYIWVLRSQAND